MSDKEFMNNFERNVNELYISKLEKEIQKLKEQLQTAVEALEKVEDPRKIGHSEPDLYTKLCCLHNIAHVALEKIKGE